MSGSHRHACAADAARSFGGRLGRRRYRTAAVRLSLGVLLLWCVLPSVQQGTKGKSYTGYDGFWIYDEEKDTVHGGIGTMDVVSKLVDKVSPCRYDGQICSRSKAVLSNPGEFVHDTGRSYCTKRETVLDCNTRMRERGFAQRLDPFRPAPMNLYPAVDGHTTTTFTCGANFHGELGLGLRISVHKPTIQTYFKLGDGLYEQEMGSGRGFKNVSLINMGFGHGFALDEQGVLYAWGTNDYGQLGITSRRYPQGHRYMMLWPQPLPFFRPFRIKMCEGGMVAGWAAAVAYKRNGEGGREVVQGVNSGEVRGSMAAEVADKFLAR